MRHETALLFLTAHTMIYSESHAFVVILWENKGRSVIVVCCVV